jgi:hypothetical protein
MAKRQSNESPIGDILKEIIQVNKLQSGMDQIAVKQAWESTMGSGVNNYTKNIVLKNTTLHIEFTSAVLREELSHGKSKIIQMINDELGRDIIKDIQFR